MTEPVENTTVEPQDTLEPGMGDYLDNYRENDYPDDPSDWRDVELS